MAQDEVIKIDTREAVKSAADLKREYKELQGELSKTKAGSQEYIDTLKKLGAVKDDIGDLKDVIGALNPEGKVQAFANVAGKLAGGFQAATGAAALFGGQSEDVEKTLLKVQAAMAFTQGIQSIVGLGDAFKVLGTVIKTNPIFLVATVIISIGTGLFLLRDKIKIVGDAFSFFGEILGEIITGVKEFTDAIGLSSFALDDLKAKTKSTADANLKTLTSYYDNALKLAKANGEDTTKIEQEKLAAVQKYNEAQLEDLRKVLNEKGTLSKEESAEFTRLSQELANGRAEAAVLEINLAKKVEAEKKAIREKAAEERRKAAEQELKNVDFNLKIRQQEIDSESELKKEGRATEQNDMLTYLEEDADFKEAFRLQEVDEDKRASENKTINEKEASEERKKLAEKEAQAKQEILATSLNAARALSDLYFQQQLQGVEKGSKAELEIKKKAFQINKAFAITDATINGIRAVQQALTNPYPLNLVLAAASGIAAAANIAKIASQKFDSGTTAASTGGSVAAPNIAAPQAPTIQPQTNLNQNGTTNTNPTNYRTYVLAADVTDKQNNASRIKTQSSY